MSAVSRRNLQSVGQMLLAMVSLAAAGQTLAAGSVQIEIRNFMFAPLELKVRVGTTVTWVNRDDEPHTVVSDPALFRSGALDTDMTFAFRFDRPGTYHVICSIHPQMSATIEVTP